MVRLNLDGSRDESFDIGNAGFGAIVDDVSVDSLGRIYAAGQFASFDGNPVNYLVRLIEESDEPDPESGSGNDAAPPVVSGRTAVSSSALSPSEIFKIFGNYFNSPASTSPVSVCGPGDLFNVLTGIRCGGSSSPSSDAVGIMFSKDLQIGSHDPEVRLLQIRLNALGFAIAPSGPGSPGSETTTFGALTRNALARFQAASGISPAVGYFGPISRGAMNGLK